MPHINQAGLDLIKSFEGCVLHSYQDSVGVWTIGFGHTGTDVVAGMSISQVRADSLLSKDLAKFESGVNSLLARSATPNQFAALVSFAYNLGLGALQESTLLKEFNTGNIMLAANEFLKWDMAGDQHLPGLARRRQVERKLFLTK